MIYFLWTCPRSMSSLVERIVMNMNIECVHEPFSKPYYYGPEKVSNRYDLTTDDTYLNVIDKLMELNNCNKNIFVKDMAYYINNKTNNLKKMDVLLKNSKHSYLVRSPNESIVSLYNMSTNNTETKWDEFDYNECGYKDLYDLYKKYPGTIFKTDNLYDPEKFIKELCNFVDTSYNDSFLSWKPLINIGIPEDWELWLPWHKSVINSTYIEKKELNKKREIPKHLISIIDENNKYYKMLLKR